MTGDSLFPIVGSEGPAEAREPGRFALADKVILLAPGDNVAVARSVLAPGSELVSADGTALTLHREIAVGHKLALRDIAEGELICKYSQIIGKAGSRIAAGEWVHTHNVTLAHELDHHEYATVRPAAPELGPELPRTFMGYRRPDGGAGTRNYIAVVAASNCSARACEAVAEEFRGFQAEGIDGVVGFPHQEGCGHHEGPDMEQLERTFKGIILNPNVGGVLMIALGCETNALTRYTGGGPDIRSVKPFSTLEIQTAGGTRKTAAAGVARVHEMMRTMAATQRVEMPVRHLVLGLNCGGSDAFSGITANPALGYASDLLVAAGGAVILGETPEIYGAEQVLTRRAVDEETGRRLVFIIRRYVEYAAKFGATMDANPSPGNKRGGITNIVEKSLGAVMKGGTTALADVVDYAARVTRPGLNVMDTPGYDPVSLTGIAAGGCNLIAFTTGRGSAIGFPTVPVLKIATNSRIYRVMNDNMDVNAGEILDGVSDVRAKGAEIYRHLVRVASGERTKSELLGHHEFAPWRIGPVM